MKIGILTFHNAFNYGAILQAYALQAFLEDMGHEVEIINYHNSQVDRAYKIFSLEYIPKRNPLKTLGYTFASIYKKWKYPLFRKNVNKILKVSTRVYNIDDTLLSSKDLIVIGSDQLWNKKITGDNDSFYWGDFVNYSCKKTITYAVCMNTESISSNDIIFIKKHIKNFSSLSVRETALAKVLCKYTNKHIDVSLDPTLLVNTNFWETKIKDEISPNKRPYVLVYAILDSKTVIKLARSFAKKHKLELVIMNPIAEMRPSLRLYQPVNPFGFVAAIANASYVITSSFHGLAFSIIFHRDFYVLGDSGKNERMHSILNSLGIGERFVDSIDDLVNKKIEYSSIDVKLELLRSLSKDYLKKAINS